MEEDADSPLTFAGLAEARWLKFWDTNEPMWLNAAKSAERRAESRDPDCAAVHEISGILLRYDGMDKPAEEEYRRAIVLDPNNSAPHLGLASIYRAGQQRDRAEMEYKAAMATEPGYYAPY